MGERQTKRQHGRAVLHGVLVVWLFGTCLPGPIEALVADYEDDVDAGLSRRALGHHEAMRAHLRVPFAGYGHHEVFSPPFATVLLSNAAIGFMNVAALEPARRGEALEALDELAARAVDPRVSPYGRSPLDVRRLGDHNLYLTHLALVLGARRRAGGDDRHDPLHRRVVEHLVRRSLASPNAHARSYPSSARFPADQTATLAALYLHDLVHGTELARRPVARWRRFMEWSGRHRSGLYVSSVSRGGWPRAGEPRGCALSWSTLYLAQFAPDLAEAQYTTYRERFFVHRLGLGGFREYRPGLRAPMDVDSGPIVAGMGMAATGFGIGAARLMGDHAGYASMLRTASTVGLPRPLGRGRQYALAPRLGEAILFHGMTARRWEDPSASTASFDAPAAPFPTAALLLAMLWLALIVRSLRKMKRALACPDAPADARSARWASKDA